MQRRSVAYHQCQRATNVAAVPIDNADLFASVWIMSPPGAGWKLLCYGSPQRFRVLAQGSLVTIALNPFYHLTTIATTITPDAQQPEL